MTHIVCMKRTNVIVDEELLERARVATGERTYSATINIALEEVVRRRTRQSAFAGLLAAAKEGPIYRQENVAENYPDLAPKEKRRISADERRMPKRKSRRAAR